MMEDAEPSNTVPQLKIHDAEGSECHLSHILRFEIMSVLVSCDINDRL